MRLFWCADAKAQDEVAICFDWDRFAAPNGVCTLDWLTKRREEQNSRRRRGEEEKRRKRGRGRREENTTAAEETQKDTKQLRDCNSASEGSKSETGRSFPWEHLEGLAFGEVLGLVLGALRWLWLGLAPAREGLWLNEVLSTLSKEVYQAQVTGHLPLLRYYSVIALAIMPPSHASSTPNPRSRRCHSPIA